jgi:SdrD B-like protein
MLSARQAIPIARRNRAHLALQTLEGREVPAFVNLGYAGAEATVNGALLRQMDTAPADQFQSFLRIQHLGLERGYNTDANFQFNVTGDHTTTHALRLADVPLVTVNGVAYRQFLLDIDQWRFLPRLSLDALRFYVSDRPDLSGYNPWTRTLGGRSAVWDLDAGGNVTVNLNAALNRGSGVGDAEVLIPDSVFRGATYVYLFSAFGLPLLANGGAESWGVAPAAPAGPGTGTLSGFVYFDADDDGVREPLGNADDVHEVGLRGVSVRLQGTNDLGQAVDVTVVTDENGHYEFTGLRAGTYSVTKLFDPPEFMDGKNTPGVAGNGQVQESNSDPAVADMIYEIHLGTDAGLSEYNFGELQIGI